MPDLPHLPQIADDALGKGSCQSRLLVRYANRDGVPAAPGFQYGIFQFSPQAFSPRASQLARIARIVPQSTPHPTEFSGNSRKSFPNPDSFFRILSGCCAGVTSGQASSKSRARPVRRQGGSEHVVQSFIVATVLPRSRSGGRQLRSRRRSPSYDPFHDLKEPESIEQRAWHQSLR
jgi:hypothetical protein